MMMMAQTDAETQENDIDTLTNFFAEIGIKDTDKIFAELEAADISDE